MSSNGLHVLIAGGTGLIGKKLQSQALKQGYRVSILTRNKSKISDSTFRYWNPDEDFIEPDTLADVDVIVNLCGAGIADKPWSNSRKKELLDSRVKPALLLLREAKKSSQLKHYISASGINCYPINTEKQVAENDTYGNDYLSSLVREWETTALRFEELCPVTLLRISAVLSEDGGALKKMKPLFKWGLGAPLGSGKQPFTWVHEDDLVRAVFHLMQLRISGAFNICGRTISNREFSKALAKSVNRWMLPIPVPAFMLRIMLGEMSEMLLNGVNTNSNKLVQTEFKFQYPTIDLALKNNPANNSRGKN